MSISKEETIKEKKKLHDVLTKLDEEISKTSNDLFLKEEYNVNIGIIESGVAEDLSILDNLDENESYNRVFSKGVSVGREIGYDAGFDAAMSMDSTHTDDDYYY